MSRPVAPQIYVSSNVSGYEIPMIGSTRQKHAGSNGVPLPDIPTTFETPSPEPVPTSISKPNPKPTSIPNQTPEPKPKSEPKPKTELTDGEIQSFWETMSGLNWADRSDKQITWSSVDNSTLGITEDTVQRNIIIAQSLRVQLKSALDNLGFFAALANENQLDLMSHIIARGREFYAFVMSEPSICSYLVHGNEYQACPLFKLNANNN